MRPSAALFLPPLLGLLGDRIGCRRAGLTGLCITLVPLALGWRFAHELWQFYLIGFFLGIAEASFAVALPLAGRWYWSARMYPAFVGVAISWPEWNALRSRPN